MNNNLNFSSLTLSLPPMNIELEESILGGIILDPGAASIVSQRLSPEAFYIEAHQLIYRAAIALLNAGLPTDLMSLYSYLHDKKWLEKIGGQGKLAQLVERTVSSVNIDKYCDLVQEKFVRRQLLSLGNKINHLAHHTWVELTEVFKDIKEEFSKVEGFNNPSEDKDLRAYSQLVKKIAQIETSELSPGAKRFKLCRLAKEFSLSPRELEDIYFKSLIDKDNEPLQTLEDLFNKYSNTERKWLMHGVLPQGITAILHAKGGIGKTLLSYHLAYCLLNGQNMDQFTVTEKRRRGWILQTDEAPEDMTQRLRDSNFTSEMDLKIKTRWTFDHIPTLRKEIERERPDFILIDSITSCSKNSIVTENDVAYAKPILLLNEIAAEFGCTILLIHHSSHEGSARGTTALYNAVGLVMKLEVDPASHDPMERLLTFQKARSRSTAKYRLQMDWETHAWRVVCQESEDPDGPIGTTKHMIVGYLEAYRGTPFEAAELYQELGSSLDNIRRCTAQLAADGIILKKGGARGNPSKYFLPSMSDTPSSNYTVSDHSDHAQKTVIRIMPRTEPAPSKDLKNTDHLITKNENLPVENLHQKNENSDQVISISQDDHAASDSFLGNVSDHVDQKHNFTETNNTDDQNSQSGDEQACSQNLIEHPKPDNDFDEKPLLTKLEWLRVGNTVQYKPSAPDGALKATCSKHHLKVIELRKNKQGISEALIKRDTWAVDYWVPIRYLSLVKR